MSALERMLEQFEAQPAPSTRSAAAAAALRAAALPTRQDENWHYANLRAIDGLRHFAPAIAPAPPALAASSLPPAALALPAALPGYARLLLLDGRLHPASAPADTATLKRVAAGAAAGDDADVRGFTARGDGRFGLVAQMFSAEPVLLRVTGQQALEILCCSTPGAPASYADLAIELAPGAQLDLVQRELADTGQGVAAAQDAATFSCNRLQLQLGAGAQLVHTRLLQAGPASLVYDTTAVDLAERASYRLRDVAVGAAGSRGTTQVTLSGREAGVHVVALAAARDGQRTDAQFTVLHRAPATRSELLFRGIASERAHVACTADVQVESGAPGSRVQQSLRGLIDGKGAEVDLRPRLTIDTDQIQANHGATTGRLDEDLLFYLLSRGLAPEAARSLLKWAFLAEALAAIAPHALRHEAERATAARLGDSPAAELLQ